MTASKIYLFTGAGNNFVVLDGRGADMTPFRQPSRITELCRRHHTDGLMILTLPPCTADFCMEFYNPDGTGGMMCGNGGRCIVAFADYLGLKPAAADGTWHFLAPDGPHEAVIIGSEAEKALWTVRLKMIDVAGVSAVKNGFFLNTGTRHYVEFRDRVDCIDMDKEARPIRWADDFQPEGTNVNFVEVTAEGLKVRTFEKGVEGETLACGTGLTASAIAAGAKGLVQSPVRLQCRRGDWLSVTFTPGGKGFTDVYLTGPAELVAIREATAYPAACQQ